jgi:HNH endonuclease
MAEFRVVTDLDLLKFTLMNRCRLAENGCWEWVGGKKNGYGSFESNGIQMKARKSGKRGAHQVSYEAYKGEIPQGLVVRHTCDNPCCVNPDHLILGTQADNVADRESRGRRKGINGEMIGTSKLTAAQVSEIRASELSYAQLALMFCVDKSTIGLIKTGKSWRHLTCVETQKVG